MAHGKRTVDVSAALFVRLSAPFGAQQNFALFRIALIGARLCALYARFRPCGYGKSAVSVQREDHIAKILQEILAAQRSFHALVFPCIRT